MASCVGDHERVLAPSVLHNLLLRLFLLWPIPAWI